MSPSAERNHLVAACVRLAREDAQTARDEARPERFASSFFRHWFREQGRAFFFLFHKNLAVTNLAHAELLALLRRHCTTGDRSHVEPIFASLDDFKSQLAGIYHAFDHQELTDCIVAVSTLLKATITSMVVVRPFFGSCSVYAPAGLHLDIETVCGLSGYVHSCGNLVYARNTEKATDAEFRDAVYKYTDGWPLPPHEGAGRLIVYSHEDFTPSDRTKRSRLAGGLDDVKIHLEKFHIGSLKYPTKARRLVDALADRDFLEQQLDIAPAGHFQRSKAEEDGSTPRSKPVSQRCLWLIADRGIDTDTIAPSLSRYFVIYHQEYANGNPCHTFDENKPAWVAHTTIPHTLIGAVLNIAAVHAPERASVADPFSGTGTTGFEVLKYPSMTCDCSDLEPLSRQLFDHNRLFLAASSSDLEAVCVGLQNVHTALKPQAGREGPSGAGVEAVLEAKALCDLEDDEAASGAGRALAECDMSNAAGRVRALFVYVALRTRLRHAVAIKRAGETLYEAFASELGDLLGQLGELQRLRLRTETTGKLSESLETLSVFGAKYSTGVTPSVHTYCSARVTHQIRDACDLPERTYDLIVADPPYGFNTDDSPEKLSALYLKMIPSLLRALKRPSAQLILCLPARSYVGRMVWAFVLPEFVSTLVYRAAGEQGLRVLSRHSSTPSPKRVFLPPYYWDSERALRRRILHFEFSEEPTHVEKWLLPGKSSRR